MLRLDYGVSRAARFLRRIQRSRPPPQEDEWTKRDHGPRRDAGAVREVPQHVVAEELIVHQIGLGRRGAEEPVQLPVDAVGRDLDLLEGP